MLLNAGADQNIANVLGITAKQEARGEAVGAYTFFEADSPDFKEKFELTADLEDAYMRNILVADLDKF